MLEDLDCGIVLDVCTKLPRLNGYEYHQIPWKKVKDTLCLFVY